MLTLTDLCQKKYVGGGKKSNGRVMNELPNNAEIKILHVIDFCELKIRHFMSNLLLQNCYCHISTTPVNFGKSHQQTWSDLKAEN